MTGDKTDDREGTEKISAYVFWKIVWRGGDGWETVEKINLSSIFRV